MPSTLAVSLALVGGVVLGAAITYLVIGRFMSEVRDAHADTVHEARAHTRSIEAVLHTYLDPAPPPEPPEPSVSSTTDAPLDPLDPTSWIDTATPTYADPTDVTLPGARPEVTYADPTDDMPFGIPGLGYGGR